jgi:hypothetical protein
MVELPSILTYARGLPKGTPRQVTFVSPIFQTEDGQHTGARLNVIKDDGDVSSVLSTVVEHGGVGQRLSDGSYIYVPWPCAAVQIRDLSLDELKRIKRQKR